VETFCSSISWRQGTTGGHQHHQEHHDASLHARPPRRLSLSAHLRRRFTDPDGPWIEPAPLRAPSRRTGVPPSPEELPDTNSEPAILTARSRAPPPAARSAVSRCSRNKSVPPQEPRHRAAYISPVPATGELLECHHAWSPSWPRLHRCVFNPVAYNLFLRW
jgi:hypothetical protein